MKTADGADMERNGEGVPGESETVAIAAAGPIQREALRVFRSFDEAAGNVDGAAVVLGTFDGVHRGHQALIEMAASWAHERNVPTAVVTFDPPPVAVLVPGLFTAPLARLDRKISIFESLKTDAVVVQHFDQTFARRSAQDFVRTDLFGLKPSAIFVGENFCFGSGREGTPGMLRRECEARHVFFEAHPLIRESERGQTISSTEIRRRLSEGDVEGAAALLGRSYALEGTVLHGRARGRDMGFPTANVCTDGLFLPGRGVYAAAAFVDDERERQPAVVNIGEKPTFGETDVTTEAFLLNETRSLYGRHLTLELVGRIRGERRFASVEDLIRRIHEDCREAVALLSR